MKKGFTLIELLAIIIILAIISIIAVPKIFQAVEDSQYKLFKNNEKLLVNAMQPYAIRGNYEMPEQVNDSVFIPLYQLQKDKVVKNITDPKDKTNCDKYSSGVVITMTEDDYIYTPFLKCNSYTSEYDNAIKTVSHVINGDNTATITINLGGSVREIQTPSQTIGIIHPSLIDYTTWINGTSGGQTGFSANGTAAESQRVIKTNPWGVNDLVWASITNDATSDSDGGWNSSAFNINPTKKYRYSVWIRRENVGTGSGSVYLGVYGYNASSSNVGVIKLSDSTVQTNYYFGNATYTSWPQIVDNWSLLVTYVHPYTYSGTASSTVTGIYNLQGIKLYSLTDCKWQSTNTKASHRTYLYYSTKTDERVYWYRPRVDLIDENEPTFNDLLNGLENPNVNDYSTINKTGTITYTATSNGTYEFIMKRKDNSIYKLNYTIDNLN